MLRGQSEAVVVQSDLSNCHEGLRRRNYELSQRIEKRGGTAGMLVEVLGRAGVHPDGAIEEVGVFCTQVDSGFGVLEVGAGDD